MMRFPITELLNEEECYRRLQEILHPEGMCCPQGHCLSPSQAPHMKDRAPVVDYRCKICNAVFNVFTGTIWAGTSYRCTKIMLILRGFAQGTPTLQLADELGCDYGTLLNYRHKMQEAAFFGRDSTPLPDDECEADEMFQNAGEKGDLHPFPDDPPRRRANKKPGGGTFANDRPPIQGCVGRESGEIRLTVNADTRQDTIEPEVESKTESACTVYTDESNVYNRIEASGRGHKTVCHSSREYARDDDGDGIREVHCNTMEGIWTGLRNFLRPFRGVHKKYLHQYVCIFEWAHNIKRVNDHFLRTMMTPLPRFIHMTT